jgi:glycerol-3-phosphate O-acyltransferase
MGDALRFALTTNALTREITNSLELATRVQQALHATAPPDEQAEIQRIITALQNVAVAAQDVNCPNPFYTIYTIDRDKF